MIYVDSSWRNQFYDGVIAILHGAQLPLYDFKHPKAGHEGFHWHAIYPQWETWSAEAYRTALTDPRAEEGFLCDMDALKACDTLVLVLPCGRSAHLELGYAIGAGKKTIIFSPPGIHVEPELMYKAVDHLCLSVRELLGLLGVHDADAHGDEGAGGPPLPPEAGGDAVDLAHDPP